MALREDIVNRSLAEIGTRSRIASIDDASPEARFAKMMFAPFRDFLLREGDYGFAIKSLATDPAAAVRHPWSFAYDWPVGCLRVRTLVPVNADPYDPVFIPFEIAGYLDTERVVVCNTAAALIIFTFQADEVLWDSLFAEAFVRFLGNGLAFALENAGKGKVKMDEALSFAAAAVGRGG